MSYSSYTQNYDGASPAGASAYQGYYDANAAVTTSAQGNGGAYADASSYYQQQQQQQPVAYQDPYNPPMGVAEGYHPETSSYPAPAAYAGHQQPLPYTAAPPTTSYPSAPEATNAVDENGLRWAWSTYPNTVRSKAKHNASSVSIPLPPMVVPMSCMYTPLKPIDVSHMIVDDARKDRCGNCGAFINRYSNVSEHDRSWVCFSCQRRNNLPPKYTSQHPALQHDTVEYIVPPQMAQGAPPPTEHPVFIFVVDTCLQHEEIEALKKNLLAALAWLPSRSLVGLVTFGARTTVWELAANGGISKCYTLRGDAGTFDTAELPQMLQVSDNKPVTGRFLLPLEDCSGTLTSLLQELFGGSEPVAQRNRHLRTTGTAVNAATFLVESLRQHGNRVGGAAAAANGSSTTTGKVLLFTGGPCTRGPGTIVGTDKGEMMRFHRDIIEGNTPHYEAAYEFYNKLSTRLSAVDTCLDVFAQSLDQVGVMEMRNAVNNTGGTFICGDAFDHECFSNSLQRYFERCDLRNTQAGDDKAGEDDNYAVRCAFGVHMEVHTSANTLVSGVLGPCNVDVEADKKTRTQRVSPLPIGTGKTTTWCVSTMDQEVTFSYVFDTATLDEGATGASEPGQRFIQFVTQYKTANGQLRVRVTSALQPVAPTSAPPSYYVQHNTFDQTCASTIIARMAVRILELFPTKWEETKRWLDTLLVTFVRRYGTFTPNQVGSLRLEPCLSLFPSFMFNLRRSEYFMVVNISPDETTYKRHWLMREPVDSCVLMIQPTLDSYDLEYPYAASVPLDSSSLRHDNIVIMDAFFQVHLMWGSVIFEWINAKYQDNPDFAHFLHLLESAEADSQQILSRRYPYPRFSRTDANGSEARHIKTRVNPAITHNQDPAHGGYGMQQNGGGTDGGNRSDLIYTDDASIVKFMESLKKAVVMVSEGGKATAGFAGPAVA